MAAEAKREPGLLRRWLQKLRESWRRGASISNRTGAAHRRDADRYGEGSSGSPWL
jgi:hypothetical protein